MAKRQEITTDLSRDGSLSIGDTRSFVHPYSFVVLLLLRDHRFGLFEVLQSELFSTPEVDDLLRVRHSDSTATSDGFPLGSTFESEFVPNAVDSGDEGGKLLGSVKRGRGNTETLITDRNGREV
jgi:hypothetical protein